MYQGEKLNSISHLVGTALSLIGFGALLTVGIQSEKPVLLASYLIFGTSLVLLYSMSTLYHSFPASNLKTTFKLLDHISIYLLIAGSYTPFMLVSMNGDSGNMILSLVWGLAAIGIASEVFLSGKAVKTIQIVIYLAMGWACTLDIEEMKHALSEEGFNWLFYGGVAYTGGIVFYIADKLSLLKHAHGIWHFFVLAGSTAHFVAIINYVK